MIVLYILGGILLLIFLLTLVPVRLEVSYQTEFEAKLRYLFFSFPLSPSEGVDEVAPAPEKAEEKPGAGILDKLKRIFRQEGFWGFLNALADFIKLLTDSSRRLLSHAKLKAFDLYLCLGGEEDAADAAILYGEVSAAVYSACAALFSLKKCRKKGVSVDLDYRTKDNTVQFSAKATLRPFHAIAILLPFLVRSIPFFKKLRA